MANIRKAYKTNKTKVAQGVWIDIDGAKFLINYADKSNPHYQAIAEKIMGPYAKRINTLSLEQGDELLLKVFNEAVVQNWKDYDDEDGKPIAYSKEVAYKEFKDYPKLREIIEDRARDIRTFQGEVAETEIKNSKKS